MQLVEQLDLIEIHKYVNLLFNVNLFTGYLKLWQQQAI